MNEPPKKVVLAYSGGLDTSVILRWLQETYGCEVVTFTADIGQGEELEPARAKAETLGVRDIRIEDLRETFVRDYVFPMFRANAIYEGVYLLGTSIARPLIARRQIEIARETGADAVAHGATGKGNDQVRFELGYYAHDPGIRVIAPWREWDLDSREALIDYAEKHQIPIPRDKRGEPPYSTDANLLHISYPRARRWRTRGSGRTRACSPARSHRKPRRTGRPSIEIEFEAGDPVAVDGAALSPAALLERLNELGGANGIGRVDLVENRFVGMKSRGVYETPGGTILIAAHRAMESLTLDRAAAHLKDELMPRYAELVYNGFWFAPERRMLQAAIDESQKGVTGTVRLYSALQGLGRLRLGRTVEGRKAPTSLYSAEHATFEADSVYDQRDAEGFNMEFKSESLEYAQQDCINKLLGVLDIMSLVSHAKFRFDRLHKIFDWTSNLTMRDGLIFVYDPPESAPDWSLNQEIFEAANLFQHAAISDQLSGALRWFRLGVIADTTVEQFQDFWFALELLAEHRKSTNKVHDSCPNCNGALYCKACDTYPMHRPYPRQAIESIWQEFAPGEIDLFQAVHNARNKLLHGVSTTEIENITDVPLHQMIDPLARLTWKGLISELIATIPKDKCPNDLGLSVASTFVNWDLTASLNVSAEIPLGSDGTPDIELLKGIEAEFVDN